MFEPQADPRVFALPPGADFARALLDGLLTRCNEPDDLARVTLILNTRRLQRRLTDLLVADGARFLPRMIILADAPVHFGVSPAPAPSPLRQQLELTELIRGLLKSQPDLAAMDSAFDLAGSLLDVFREMEEEAVCVETLKALNIADQSGYWDRSLRFLSLADEFGFGTQSRSAIKSLAEKWKQHPIGDPVILAGSTGSRGGTRLLMQEIARLPRGAVILPGFDTTLPADIWDQLFQRQDIEDHPQHRFARFLKELDLVPSSLPPWTHVSPPSVGRNRLLSLAMRPAPSTDQWRTEGPKLPDLRETTQKVTLIEAATPRQEADAIALRMRQAIQDGQTAALVTPDRRLSRQVAACLDRWGIRPDDSAGQPAHLSPPGRLLRQVAALLNSRCDSGALMALLKHPLTCSAGTYRGDHLLCTRELELHLRKQNIPFPTAAMLRDWATKSADTRNAWTAWVCDVIAALSSVDISDLHSAVSNHLKITEFIATGPQGADDTGSGELWQEAAGKQCLMLMDNLLIDSESIGTFDLAEYRLLLDRLLMSETVQSPEQSDPRAMIWGTLEARSQYADVLILGGLNEGIWPAIPSQDPWLNRQMRLRAGLLLPERRIGLAAHDFQMAAAAGCVVLSRSCRDAEAETIPSRWLTRLICLMEGLPDRGGADALGDMRRRGGHYLSWATQLAAPATREPPARRPCPAPPISQRPRELSITRIKTLIQDPFAIYAQYILRLKTLDPLCRKPDAAAFGIFLHDLLQQIIEEGECSLERFQAVTDQALADHMPWPATRILWAGRIQRIAKWFVDSEADRQALGQPRFFEEHVSLPIKPPEFRLTGRIDRVDIATDGSALIYDYKSGTPPSAKEQLEFDKQLLLSALMVENGAIRALGPAPVIRAAYIGFASGGTESDVKLDSDATAAVYKELRQLISVYLSEKAGYLARRDVPSTRHFEWYDHLARYGEWDDTEPAVPEPLS